MDRGGISPLRWPPPGVARLVHGLGWGETSIVWELTEGLFVSGAIGRILPGNLAPLGPWVPSRALGGGRL